MANLQRSTTRRRGWVAFQIDIKGYNNPTMQAEPGGRMENKSVDNDDATHYRRVGMFNERTATQSLLVGCCVDCVAKSKASITSSVHKMWTVVLLMPISTH